MHTLTWILKLPTNPREEFERQYQERLDYELILSVYILPFIFASHDDIGRDYVTKLDFKLDERCYERIEGIMEDYE